MGLAICRVDIPSKSTIPEDTVTNTFHIGGEDTALANAQNFAANAGNTLYDWVPAFGSVEMNWAGATVTAYDAEDPSPRPVILLTNLGILTPTNDQPMPPEVALVSSWQAPPVAGIPQARRRGRAYFGPFNELANTLQANQQSRPNPALVTSLVDGIQEFLGNIFPAVLVVFSKAAGAGFIVDNGWVDDAWDTQRRRGNVATSRTSWSV